MGNRTLLVCTSWIIDATEASDCEAAYLCVLHICNLCVCATYADPGMFEGLCGSNAFTGVDG